MNSYQKEQAFIKVQKVIKSCKTKEQLIVAEKMARNFFKRVDSKLLRIYLLTLIQNHSINCI
jgi:hypothetical protein